MIDPDSELAPRYQSITTTPDWYQTNIPCQVGCPAHTDVSTYIGLISQARFDEAYLLNREANVVPGVLGRTCARPCEPVCRRNKIDGKPIAICWLKRAAADHREFRHRATPPPITKEKKVAIVGAGSAGLACARDLRQMGYPVTIYEADAVAGGVMVNGIPVWRLPRHVTYEETTQYMNDLGVEVKYNTRVGRDIEITDLLKQYDAVYLAAGCYVSNDLTGPDNKIIPGANLKGVEHGIALLAKTNFGEPASIGKNVIVLGGGFTAMDCCRTSIRFGAEKVYVLYRRSREEMGSDEYEVDEAEFEHVEFQYLVSPLEVLSDDGIHVSGLRVIRNKLGDPDASGRRRPIPVKGSEYVIPADTIIPAFGQYSDSSWLHLDGLNVQVNKRNGVPLVDRDTWMTSYPGLFAGGDYTEGSRNLISAIGDGRDAAGAINRYLGGQDIPAEPPEEIELPDYRRGMVDDYESIAHENIPGLPLKQRYSNTRETETGYTPEQAVEQARRCLQCQLNIMIDPSICILCSGCVDICPYDCISMEGLSRVVKGDPMHRGTENWRGGADMIIDEEKCIRCGLCIVRCPTDAISMVQFQVASPNHRWAVSKIPMLNL
ncbi:MAG TPA: FAD-dependent oxidoreductase [Ktedonobacteraceae bacterium]|jgi:NADPH-dependent glutamate synthase beta subunit-like oxidoreductase|nr:FAD-dependent oxidoreductase [Ktedonobacteraceae bacterium]